VYYKSGTLAALDFRGQVLWRTNLQERFGKDTLWWDIGTSPVLTVKHVVVAVMHEDDSFMAAFEKKSGKVGWKVARNYDCAREGSQSYTTPLVAGNGGDQRIVVFGAEHLTAHDAVDGKLLWSCGGFNPEGRKNWTTVASPVIVGNVAVVPYGRGSLLAGIKLGGEGDITPTHRLWTLEDSGSFVPTPAAYEGRVYVLGDQGMIRCFAPKTGKLLGSKQLPRNRAKYYASPVVADGKIYAAREDGVVFVVRAQAPFEVLSENAMGERMIASPVPVAGRLFLRGEHHLFCVKTIK
jgi:outer membrane protein assembly factor BamB